MTNAKWEYFTSNNIKWYIVILHSLVKKCKLIPVDTRKPENYEHVCNALYVKVNVKQDI